MAAEKNGELCVNKKIINFPRLFACVINYSKKPGGWITWLHDDACSSSRNMSLHINYPSVLFWTFFSADVYFKCVWPVFHPQRPITSKQGVDMKRSLLAGHCFFSFFFLLTCHPARWWSVRIRLGLAWWTRPSSLLWLKSKLCTVWILSRCDWFTEIQP